MASCALIPAIVCAWLLLSAPGDAPPARARADDTPIHAPGDQGESEAPAASSYTLFLPSTYSKERLWPILFCFDPGRRGKLPVELFREAAERLGFIIVSSNSFSSSESTDRSIDAMVSLWNDAIARFPVDFDRVYAAGFSGGGRLCWLLAQEAPDVHFAGIIEVGAGFPWQELPTSLDTSCLAFYGLVGETDFNYYEVQRVARILRKKKIRERLVSFEGSHEWPASSRCGAALEWLQIEAMRSERLSIDEPLIDRIYQGEFAAAIKDEAEGRLIEARDGLLALTDTFGRLRDVSEAKKRLSRLEMSRKLVAQIDQRNRQERMATDALRRATTALEDATQSPDTFSVLSSDRLSEQMRLGILIRNARSEYREERLAAQRVLESIFVRTAVYMPRQLMERGDPAAAALVLEIATTIKPDEADVWRRLARAYCGVSRREKALDALDKAVQLGLSNPETLGTDPSFLQIQDDPRFQEILSVVAKPPAEPSKTGPQPEAPR